MRAGSTHLSSADAIFGRHKVVMLPQQAKPETKRTILDCGPFTIFPRPRTPTGSFRVISEFPHRHAAFRIAGIDPGTEDPAADALAAGQTAAIIVYPVVEDTATLSGTPGSAIDSEKVTLGFHIITPFSAAPTDGKLIKWRTVDSTNPNAIVVDVVGK